MKTFENSTIRYTIFAKWILFFIYICSFNKHLLNVMCTRHCVRAFEDKIDEWEVYNPNRK